MSQTRDVARPAIQGRMAEGADGDFLPNFCRGAMVVNVVVLAEFLAIAVTIIGRRFTESIFQDLFLISIFVQWIALVSIAALCALRRPLNALPPERASIMAWLLLICVTFVVSEAAVWLLYATGEVATPRPEWYSFFHLQNLIVSAIVNALALRYFLARHQLRQRMLSEAMARNEIARYRIRRHFLFNSMNIIASLTSRAPVRAEAAIEDMADLFRLMLDDTKDLVLVHSEMAVARKYVKLEKLRLEQRLSVNWEAKSIPRSAKTPVLMLQLLLENAIRYGVEPFTEGGEISIKIGCSDDTLSVDVTNVSRNVEIDGESQRDSTAIAHIRARLQDHYHGKANIEINEADGQFAVGITHPAFGETE